MVRLFVQFRLRYTVKNDNLHFSFICSKYLCIRSVSMTRYEPWVPLLMVLLIALNSKYILQVVKNSSVNNMITTFPAVRCRIAKAYLVAVYWYLPVPIAGRSFGIETSQLVSTYQTLLTHQTVPSVNRMETGASERRNLLSLRVTSKPLSEYTDPSTKSSRYVSSRAALTVPWISVDCFRERIIKWQALNLNLSENILNGRVTCSSKRSMSRLISSPPFLIF